MTDDLTLWITGTWNLLLTTGVTRSTLWRVCLFFPHTDQIDWISPLNDYLMSSTTHHVYPTILSSLIYTSDPQPRSPWNHELVNRCWLLQTFGTFDGNLGATFVLQNLHFHPDIASTDSLRRPRTRKEPRGPCLSLSQSYIRWLH